MNRLMCMWIGMTCQSSSGSIQSLSREIWASVQASCGESNESSKSTKPIYWKGGTKNMDVSPGERVKTVRCTKDTLQVDLLDGRTIIVPLAWYPRLLHATPQERNNWKIAGGGYGIHWPDIDEDLSVEGLLRGLPAPRVAAEALFAAA